MAAFSAKKPTIHRELEWKQDLLLLVARPASSSSSLHRRRCSRFFAGRPLISNGGALGLAGIASRTAESAPSSSSSSLHRRRCSRFLAGRPLISNDGALGFAGISSRTAVGLGHGSADSSSTLLRLGCTSEEEFEGQMADVEVTKRSIDVHKSKTPFSTLFSQLPHKLQNCLEARLKRVTKDYAESKSVSFVQIKEKGSPTAFKVDLDRQLQCWRENPLWVDHPPDIKVSVPKGSLCNLNVKVNVGLPPDAVYNIVTDPDNKRVFKNIKEVISRRVLVDKGQRQVVEVEQAALWKFLWWSGTISVHVLVDQNREDHSMRFKQVKTGFMKRFEGCWRVEPLFVDEKICFPFKPKTAGEYYSCTGGKGRIGSTVSLEQLIQPSILPPPPISWYLRGITSRTTEMLIHDFLAETARIRGGSDSAEPNDNHEICSGIKKEHQIDQVYGIKERWAIRRRNARQHHKRLTRTT